MSLDAKGAAALALHRFGFGPRAGSIAAIASDPRGALLAELDKPGIGQIVNAELMTSRAVGDRGFNFRQERQARAIAQKQAEEQRKAVPRDTSMEGMEAGSRTMQPIPGRAQPIAAADRLPRGQGADRRGDARPRSASSSGWSGSGRTISASPPT